ncbi:unnamed protein product [marine sediment metagenome]|uniref:Uncharacterized protein n=1 Tax=marine sediment metagenome TaxID=412755 RepID=X0WC19_9ZZZZ
MLGEIALVTVVVVVVGFATVVLNDVLNHRDLQRRLRAEKEEE